MSLAIGARQIVTEPRPLPSRMVRLLVPVLSLVVGILIGGLVVLVTGGDPIAAFREIVNRGFLGELPLIGTLVRATPLILTGLTAVVAFRMKIWNIGGEGQLIVGAVAASGVGLWLGENVPGPLTMVLMLLAGIVAGALWAALSALPRAYLNTDEVITTLMLNFVALSIMNYLIFSSFSFWRDSRRVSFPTGRFIPDVAFLPRFWGRLHIGVFVAVGAALLLWWVLRSTRWGFELEVAGDSPRAAAYAGMNVDRKIVSVLVVSGALSGLAGSIEIGGVLHNLDPRALSLGVGFAGIVVAAVARLNPIGVIVVAFLVAGLNNAGVGLQSIGISSDLVLLLQGIFFLSVVGGEYFLRNTIRIRAVVEPVAEARPA